jgi:hypothetical protein
MAVFQIFLFLAKLLTVISDRILINSDERIKTIHVFTICCWLPVVFRYLPSTLWKEKEFCNQTGLVIVSQ